MKQVIFASLLCAVAGGAFAAQPASLPAMPQLAERVISPHEYVVIEDDIERLVVSGRVIIKGKVALLVFDSALDVVVEGEVMRTSGHGMATFLPGSVLRGREITERQQRIFE